MSGLEGLAALGLACNIFQVISFGRETLGLVKSVYGDGTFDDSLVNKITAIQCVTSNIIAVNIPQSGSQERKLVDVTKKCTGVARGMDSNGARKVRSPPDTKGQTYKKRLPFSLVKTGRVAFVPR